MNRKFGLTAGLICLSLTACNDDLKIDLEGEQHVRVYQDDQALGCDAAGISVETHGKLLIDEGIELHCSQKGHDGMSYTESCNSETGSINIFTIHDKDLAEAESLGFSRLSTLPDAQFDNQCEYKVISDHRKYALLDQLNSEYAKWQTNQTPSYQFQFNTSFSDCPTFAPTPVVLVTVTDNEVSTVYDTDSETFLSNIDNYMTIDELFKELELQLKLTPLEAGLHAGEPKVTPDFNELGVPEQYYLNAGSDECDAINYTVSEFLAL